MTSPHRRLTSVVFVDFDNVYAGLRSLGSELAETFATEPAAWMARLAHGEDEDGPFTRRFLARSCYLNPAPYSRFRAFYTDAGFRVVDCPSLTQQGKSSADIALVLDVVDALAAPTRYDEFLLLSADADFTPLVHRCRAADRRVSVLTAGPSAAAYRAVADQVIGGEEFMRLVLGTGADPAAGPDAEPVPDSHAGHAAGPPPRAPAAVLGVLRSAPGPVASAVAAQAAIAADPSLPVTGWDGRGFASWLTLNVPAAGYASRPAPGYVWDAARFSAADLPSGNEWAGATPLQRQVGAATGVPRVSGEQYAAVLTALAEDVNARRFDRAETARRVRDDCARAGHPVGRALVTYVVNGLLHAGFPMRAPTSAAQLAGAWVDTVEAQYLGAGMALDDAARRELRDWLGGGLAPLL